MLQVDHRPTRRASTSSALSHADSFHSLPPLSHEPHAHEAAVTLPYSSADATDAYASPCQLHAYHKDNATYAQSSSTSSSARRAGDEDLHSADMERKDSKFTVTSYSSSSRRYSTTQRASMSPTTSRRPSVSRHGNSFSQSGTQRPQLGSRRNTQTQEDAYAAHARACALFPSSRRSSRPSSQIYSVPPSQVSLGRKTSQTAFASPRESSEQSRTINTAVQSRAPSFAGTLASTMNAPPFDQEVKQMSPPRPQTVIDWTDPATRKTTYERYDQDRKGVRGLWRKLTPDCFWRGSRVEFYDDKADDDACSVRRYRLDIDDLKDGDSESVEQEKASNLRSQYKKSWSCFGRSEQS